MPLKEPVSRYVWELSRQMQQAGRRVTEMTQTELLLLELDSAALNAVVLRELRKF